MDIDNPLKEKSNNKAKFVGHFQRRPVENGYHDVELILERDVLIWVTKIGSRWELKYDGRILRKSDDTVYKAQVGIAIVLLQYLLQSTVIQNLSYRSLSGLVQTIIFQGEYFYRV